MIDRPTFSTAAGAPVGASGLAMAADPTGPEADVDAMGQDLEVPGWTDLIDDLRGLPSRMLAKLPAAMRDDPQVQQEVGRLALAALTSSALGALSAGGDHPFFLPQLNILTFAGQPNPDTIYRFTPITPGGSYRLRGEGGKLRIAMLSQMAPRAKVDGVERPQPVRAYNDFNTLTRDAQGRFDVLLSPTKPEGYEGDWWALQPTSNRLQVRFVRSDWRTEREPTVSIERVDVAANCPRPSAAVMQERLRKIGTDVSAQAPMFVDKVERLRRECGDNKLQAFDVSPMGGLPTQFYYEGPFELRADEALILEAKAPQCLYRSVMVTNGTYDTIDWYNNHSCLNDSQATVDADGVLRIVVAPQDPGVPNWLDTAGHLRGLVQGRWLEADAHPIPTTKVVRLSEVRNHVPPETPTVSPAQREAIIRERRSMLQQRSLW